MMLLLVHFRDNYTIVESDLSFFTLGFNVFGGDPSRNELLDPFKTTETAWCSLSLSL